MVGKSLKKLLIPLHSLSFRHGQITGGKLDPRQHVPQKQRVPVRLRLTT